MKESPLKSIDTRKFRLTCIVQQAALTRTAFHGHFVTKNSNIASSERHPHQEVGGNESCDDMNQGDSKETVLAPQRLFVEIG
jgi:hypothetical protein